MEFIKYQSIPYGDLEEDRTMPRIGTLRIADSFHSSDCNFYPNHEVFGISQGGEYPLYGKFEIDRDERGKPTGRVYLEYAWAHVPGITYDGKIGYNFPFHIYGYEIKEYVGFGKPCRDTWFKIELNAPFYLADGPEEDRLPQIKGYDLDWLETIILEPSVDENGARMWSLEKDVVHRMGVLICRHQFDLVLNNDLSFKYATSIDLGETNSYDSEEEFEEAFPGIIAAIHKAQKQGVLRVYKYDWDGYYNHRSIVPFPG